MYLRIVDVKVTEKANGRSDSATINTSSKGGCLLVSKMNNSNTSML